MSRTGLKDKVLSLDIFCWLCGEESNELFSFDHAYPKNMGRGCCPACGAIIWVETRDIIEVKDRREVRGIPR